MATLLVKSLAVAGGLGGVTAISCGTYYLTTQKEEKRTDSIVKDTTPKETVVTKKKVTEFLKAKGLKLIPQTDGKWTGKWDTFKSKHPENAPTSPWNFSKWPLNDGDEGINSFKRQCETLGSTLIADETDTIYTQINENCTTTIDAGDH